MPSSRPQARHALTALTAGPIALSAAGCGVLGGLIGPEHVRDASVAVTTASTADIFILAVGDCLDIEAMDRAAKEYTSLPVVPCSEPHTGEVYAERVLSDDEYPDGFPGGEAVASVANEFCRGEFEAFVGTAHRESVLDYWHFWPTELSWAEGDRVVQCVVESVEPVTGTLEGAGI